MIVYSRIDSEKFLFFKGNPWSYIFEKVKVRNIEVPVLRYSFPTGGAWSSVTMKEDNARIAIVVTIGRCQSLKLGLSQPHLSVSGYKLG